MSPEAPDKIRGLLERNLRGIEVLISELKQRLASLEAHAKQIRKLLTPQ